MAHQQNKPKGVTESSENSFTSSDEDEQPVALPAASIAIPSIIKFGYYDFQVSGSRWTAKCSKCQLLIKDKRGITSGFTKPLSRRHEATANEYHRQRNRDVCGGQSSMTSFITSTLESHYSDSNPKQKALTKSLVENLIINCTLAVSLVDNTYFRKFVSELDPKFKLPCRQTVTNSILPKLRCASAEKVQNILDACSTVALTADIWTDRRSHAFLGITVHAFNNGQPSSHLLNFSSFHGSHTGQKIAEAMEGAISQARIQDKVSYIVTDNASNMKKAMSVLINMGQGDEPEEEGLDDPSLWEDYDEGEGDTFMNISINIPKRIPCFAHSLQLVIRDALSSLATIRPALAKCSKLTNLVHQSALFRSEFEKVLGTRRSIPAANETRWNSTFRQLKAIVEFDPNKMADVLRESSQENLILSQREFQQIQELVEILEPFAEATDLTQGHKTVTISCVIPILMSLTKILIQQMEKFRSFVPLIKSLKQGLYDRFFDIYKKLGIINQRQAAPLTLSFDDDIYLMACALDPIYAFNWLQDHPGADDDKEILRQRITGLLQTELAKVVDVLTREQSHSRAATAVISSSDPGQSQAVQQLGLPATAVHISPPSKKKCSLFAHYKSSTANMSTNVAAPPPPSRVLVDYLETINQVEFNSDELGLPELLKRDKYSILKPLFERLLCVPATSAPVERIFSTSGLIMRPHRARMSDTLLETLVLLKCNSGLE